MDIVERLRSVFGVVVKADDCFEEDYSVARKAADEIERLRQQNAELVEVLKLALASHGVVLTSDPPQDAWKANGVAEKARAAIAKATGGE